MTSRAGAKASSNRVARTFYHCILLKIARRDLVTVRMTNHDRPLTFEGEKYEPILFADISAERREGGLRSGNQEARAIMDGDRFTVSDMLARRWVGAEVLQVRTDWRRPWEWTSRDRKWIRNAQWSDGAIVCTLEARTQILTRPAGGRFGGTFAVPCPYTLGDLKTCKKDVGIGTGYSGAGASVATIIEQRKHVQFSLPTWPGTFVDDYFRDGSFQWIWAAPLVTSTITASSTATTLTDTTKAWDTDEHVGRYVRFLTAAGAGVDGWSWAIVSANTATTLTFGGAASGLPMPVFATGKPYDICDKCANWAVVSPIVYYKHAARDLTFFLPTPFDIAPGDSGRWVAGCDGLLTTCAGKFGDASHPLNYGGDPYQPSAQAIIEPAEGS